MSTLAFGAIDACAALERIAATMALETGRRLESGWWPLESLPEIDGFDSTRAAALERGARERERYEFLATVGHELRTPLTSIRGCIETLLDGDVGVDTPRRFLETARREAVRAIHETGKASGAGGIVELSVNCEGPFICVSVEDSGRGVALEDRERIFVYGMRADMHEGIRGKGVGLTIVRSIVERAGGRIDVTDSHLGGAKFTIALPSIQTQFVPAPRPTS